VSEYLGAPVDPGGGPTFALGGRVVTMRGQADVVDDGVVYVAGGSIAAVTERTAPPPAGFEHVKVLQTKGTIYPGLIDLHNHLSYDVLQLWAVPKKYSNRDQWAKGDTYRKLVTGPMKVLGQTPEYVPAIVRFVEAKCLVAGTTTSQGIALASNAGIQRYYRGVVRNVEQTDEPALPEAVTHISDVEATDREKFLKRLRSASCLLLHLSEGVDAAARSHFLDLKGTNGDWAVTRSLAGIHCVALEPADFAVLAHAGASMVWSPLSNLLLYGQTADVKAARAAGLTVALGPDWSPSGSKNLLGELKLARLVSALPGGAGLSDFELLSLATRDAAQVLRWDKALGTVEKGKRADLLVVRGADGDAYGHLFGRGEDDVELVVINGCPRYGAAQPMQHLLASDATKAETATIAGRKRLLALQQASEDPAVAGLSLAQATELLRDGLKHLPELAKSLVEHPRLDGDGLRLVLDNDDDEDFDVRLRLGENGGPPLEAVSTPLPDLLVPLELDALTVADDDAFVSTLARESNLPAEVAAHVAELY
jgi:cytosine/adenosine deaminase-related metal-dependent hydrolase